MEIADVSVEQIDRAMEGLGDGAPIEEVAKNHRALERSELFGRAILLVGVMGERLAALGDVGRVARTMFTVGIEAGFKLRDIAAVDETLNSVERASKD